MVCEFDNPELGFVGSPVEMHPEVLTTVFASDHIPVVAPLGTRKNGETFNVNADTAAGAISAALKADRLLLLTDVDGVKDSDGNVVTQLTAAQVKKLTKENIISGGMIPKTETSLTAIDGGVRAVVIIDGRVQNAVLLELFTDHGAGSLIRKK